MNEIALAHPSSTVVLVREAAAAPEVFMVRRHASLTFGAAYAFPGGVVDEDDAAVHDFCTGLGTLDANTRLGVKSNGLDYYSAAIRELLEESGVLLANLEALEEDPCTVRDALNDGLDSWTGFVERTQLQLRCDQLHYFSHWLTPVTQARRYSTRFFLAGLPDGQTASHCGGELTASRWATARDMLEAGRNGEVELHFPTVKTLELIARHQALEPLLDWARSCIDWGVTSMLPAEIVRDGQAEIVLPGDKDYPGTKS